MPNFKFVCLTAAVILAATPALAADLGAPVGPASLAAPAPADWTGFYVGGFGGLGASEDALSLTAPPPAVGTIDLNVTGNGAIGGIRAGYDFDLGGFTVGALGSFALTNIGGQLDGSIDLGAGPTSFNIHSKLQNLGTVEGKIGASFGNLLAYAHGGWAFGHSEAAYSVGAPISLSDSSGQDRSGFVAGAGLEYRVTDQLSLTTEYGYYDLGTKSVATIGGVPLNDHLTFHAVTAGLNFRF